MLDLLRTKLTTDPLEQALLFSSQDMAVSVFVLFITGFICACLAMIGFPQTSRSYKIGVSFGYVLIVVGTLGVNMGNATERAEKLRSLMAEDAFSVAWSDGRVHVSGRARAPRPTVLGKPVDLVQGEYMSVRFDAAQLDAVERALGLDAYALSASQADVGNQ